MFKKIDMLVNVFVEYNNFELNEHGHKLKCFGSITNDNNTIMGVHLCPQLSHVQSPPPPFSLYFVSLTPFSLPLLHIYIRLPSPLHLLCTHAYCSYRISHILMGNQPGHIVWYCSI